jgi:hypothetical protein
LDRLVEDGDELYPVGDDDEVAWCPTEQQLGFFTVLGQELLPFQGGAEL